MLAGADLPLKWRYRQAVTDLTYDGVPDGLIAVSTH